MQDVADFCWHAAAAVETSRNKNMSLRMIELCEKLPTTTYALAENRAAVDRLNSPCTMYQMLLCKGSAWTNSSARLQPLQEYDAHSQHDCALVFNVFGASRPADWMYACERQLVQSG